MNLALGLQGEECSTRSPPISMALDDFRVIEVNHVSKVLDSQRVVDDVTFDVAPGQVFGLIGPSGSGKTTMIRMMVGVHVPTSGEIRVFGVHPVEFPTSVRERIGYMPQGSFLYPSLSVWENLSHVAGLYGLGWFRRRKLIPQVLEELGLAEARSKLAQELSGGMMRRLQLAAVLVHDPDLGFIDEPMEGLDPLLRHEVWDILQAMKGKGKTVVMTTHNMSEAERCDTLALMSEGRLVATGTPVELRRRVYGGDMIRLMVDSFSPQAYAALNKLPGVKQVNIVGGNDVRLVVEDADSALPQAVGALRDLGIAAPSAQRYQPPFDEVFERLVRGD